QLGILHQREKWKALRAAPLAADDALVEGFIGALPFPLTGAQRRAIREIRADLAKPMAMSRLLQGDVGSGKTIVAAAAAFVALSQAKQVAIMAPTEILAEQHQRTFAQLFAGTRANV